MENFFVSENVTGTPVAYPTGWNIFSGVFLGANAYIWNINLTNRYLVGASLAQANLSNLDFTNSDLTNADLTLADLSGANLTNVDLTGANLSADSVSVAVLNALSRANASTLSVAAGANLSSANLHSAKLNNANIKGTTFNNADLTNASLAGAKINGANFAGATLLGVSSGSLSGVPASLPSNWHLVGGYLIGPGADLEGANLSGQNLASFNLTGANLANVNFAGANLTGVVFTNADLTGARFSSVQGLQNPVIAGQMIVGQSLTANAGSWPIGVTVSFSWLRDSSPIANATSNTYKLTGADVGHKIKVTANVTLASLTLSSQSSDFTDTIKALPVKPIVLTLKSKISGLAKVGKTLNAVASVNIRNAKLTYQWLIDGKKIRGATSAKFKIPASAKSHKISLLISASLLGSKTVSATSATLKIS